MTSRHTQPTPTDVAGSGDSGDASPEAQITTSINELCDWRGQTLSRLRGLIHEADPDVVEEVKWVKPSNPAGVPTWSHQGILCTGEVYKDKVKLTFAHGASLPDPTQLFNSSLEASVRRAIDFTEGAKVDASAFRDLIRAAVESNNATAAAKAARKR